MDKFKKISIISGSIIIAIIALITALYLWIIPAAVSNSYFQRDITNLLKKTLGAEVFIDNIKLKTSLSTRIVFSVDDLYISKNGNNILAVEKFNSDFSFSKILNKKIIINELGADKIFANINELLSLFPQKEPQKEEKINWSVDIFNSKLYIKDCLILYKHTDDINLKVLAKNLEITETRNPKFVKFDINLEVLKNNKKLALKITDNNKVYFKNRSLIVDNCDFYINKSKVLINYIAKEGNIFDLKLLSKNFSFEDVEDIINSNLVIPNGKDLLEFTKDLKGSFDFDINLKPDGMTGNIRLNKLMFNVPLASNLPIIFNHGKFIIGKDKILIKKIKGYYGKSAGNKMTFNGTVHDYTTADCTTNIEGYVVGTNELASEYLSKMAGVPVEFIGKTISKIKFNMIGSKIDIAVIFRLLKGYDILVDGNSLTPTDYERAFRADMTIDGSNLELKDLNYYIANSFKSGVIVTPLLKVFGNFDLYKNMAIKNIGFEITKPLPSEFFNLFMAQKIFRKGKISGNFEYIATSQIPYLKGQIVADEVRIPSQRLSINKGILLTSDNLIKLDMDGKYRRTDYQFNGSVLNEMKLPIVVKNVNLNIDNLDIEKVLASIQRQQEIEAKRKAETKEVTEPIVVANNNEEEDDDGGFIFTPNVFIIENCLLSVVKGSYKQIDFGNVNANLTLNKEGILDIHSNKFDIAEGTSSTHIVLDMVKQKYNLHLGIKDVNADAIATSILNLPREITGKARGIIALETDNTFKLNGKMKFDIKNGSIAKVGLIEYALNFVSLFRNPLAMISPATFVDMVNVPEGTFDKIEGTLILKDNSIQGMMIKSQAPTLASFIVGKYDLEKSDAILRIYTKFSNKHKGMAGFLRNISLNSLASSIPLSSRNDSAYYEAEINQIPEIQADDRDCQVFLTKIDGDVEHNNFLSSLKRIR